MYDNVQQWHTTVVYCVVVRNSVDADGFLVVILVWVQLSWVRYYYFAPNNTFYSSPGHFVVPGNLGCFNPALNRAVIIDFSSGCTFLDPVV